MLEALQAPFNDSRNYRPDSSRRGADLRDLSFRPVASHAAESTKGTIYAQDE